MTNINWDSDTFTFHRRGCKHLRANSLKVGFASTHADAMKLDWVQTLLEQTYEGDLSIIWFMPCTGIKNPAGYSKPDLDGIDPAYAATPRGIVPA